MRDGTKFKNLKKCILKREKKNESKRKREEKTWKMKNEEYLWKEGAERKDEDSKFKKERERSQENR